MENLVALDFCSSCGAPLTAESPPAVTERKLELEVLASFATAAEADMVREILEANGIQTLLRGKGDPIGAACQAAPLTLLVEKQDLAEAHDIYGAFFTGDVAEDPESEPA